MEWKRLLEPDIQTFIRDHEENDVRELALKKPSEPDWPYPLILDQIKARQKAALKIPLWAPHHSDIIFPPADILEQASSAATARYKAGLVKGKTFADLTGGAGVDSCAMTEHFESGICVEQNENAAALIAHNLPLLSKKPVTVQHELAEEFIKKMEPVDLIYLDPQRRTTDRKTVYKLEECSPNIFDLLPIIKDKTKKLMIKTSPMLDIWQTLENLKHVIDVHIIEWQGECKEVLYILDFDQQTPIDHIPITAAIVDDQGNALKTLTFTKTEENDTQAEYLMPTAFLYEPGPAFQKSGGFNVLAQKFGLHKFHKHTHLYSSDEFCPDFPGRSFKILDILPVDRKFLPLKQANLSIRNFPSDVQTLRKQLGLREGGENYLFACTLADANKVLIHCQKTKKSKN